MWTLKNPAEAPRFKALLDSCKGLVPGMLEFEVGIRSAMMGLRPDIRVSTRSRSAGLGALLALAACGRPGGAVSPDAATAADATAMTPGTMIPGGCPTEREDSAGKIHHEAFLRADPAATQVVAVQLRDNLPPLPPCPICDSSW